MSEFHYIQLPPDGTGKKSSQTGVLELKYKNGTHTFKIGDVVTTGSGVVGDVVYIDGGSTASSGEVYLKLQHGSATSASTDDSIGHNNQNVALVSQNTSIFYTQEIVMTGGNNPFNRVSVDRTGSIYMRFAGGSMSYDAFGKLQSSQSTTIREYQPVYNTLPDDFEEYTLNGGTITWDNQLHAVQLATTTAPGSHARRRSHIHHKYQTGVATTILFSGWASDDSEPNVIRRIGLYDDNDGVFFQIDGDGDMDVVLRSSVSGSVVEDVYIQPEWSNDRLDGTNSAFNVSGVSLDTTKTQVMFIDFQWLGGGRIRFGFVIDGVNIIVHEINNANNIAGPYMRTGSLPYTCEQFNVGGSTAPSSYYNISAAVKCEGDYKPRQILSSGSLPPAVNVPILSNYNDYTFIGAVRPVKYICYDDNVTYTGTVTVNASIPGDPITPGTITTVANNFVSSGFVSGDYIQLEGANKNNRIIYIIDTVTAGTITLTSDSPPIFQDTNVTCTIVSKKKTPNRAIGEIKDITLMDVSGQNKPMLVELVKNAGLVGTTTGLLTVDNIGGTITGYTNEEIVDIEDVGGGIRAVGQVTVVGGNVTAVNIVQAGHGYTITNTGLILTGRESDANTCTVDVASTGISDFTWQDAYSGNMLDAAKPSTGVVATTSEANTVYTTLMKDGYVKMDLREHFHSNTELMFRKANLDDEPDNWTIRVKTFNDSDTASIAFAISWLEVRA